MDSGLNLKIIMMLSFYCSFFYIQQFLNYYHEDNLYCPFYSRQYFLMQQSLLRMLLIPLYNYYS